MVRLTTVFTVLLGLTTLPAWAQVPPGDPFQALQAQITALQQTVSAQGQQISSLSQSVATLSQAVTTLSNAVNTQTTQIAALKGYVNPLQGVLTYNAASSTVQFTGVNVQIVNGMGTTPTTNGFGNLIVGYNEDDGDARGVCSVGTITDEIACTAATGSLTRSLGGSHNLVIGSGHGYSQYGGMVIGQDNLISGPFAVVCGGDFNTASGQWSSICAGSGNTASGKSSSVTGGEGSTASGTASSVSGGKSNTASGDHSNVSAGYDVAVKDNI